MDIEEKNKYFVNIEVFEGPLDLLLHLVNKNRIDIQDIPIHEITDQYLEYLKAAEKFNLELGSSFFQMAATLLYIKSRMLLPKRRQTEEDETEDPRRELARSLEELKKMREVKFKIECLMNEQAPYRMKEAEELKNGVYNGKISIKKLSQIFFSLYEENFSEEKILSTEEVSLDEKMSDLEFIIKSKKVVSVIGYFKAQKSRIHLAVSLLALLEFIRLGRVKLGYNVHGMTIETA